MSSTPTRDPKLESQGQDSASNRQSNQGGVQLGEREQRQASDRSPISASVVQQVVREEGERELERSAAALLCSALAAGLSMGFSLVAQGLLHTYIPNTPWRPLIEGFGYSLGFLIVVLGRQQLFTENTLTVIIPLLAHFNRETFMKVARLWGLVLLANLVGAFLFALLISHTPVFSSDVQRSFVELSQKALTGDFGTLIVKGVFAGWLIALMVWLLPFADTTRLQTIIIITYIVGIGSFAHVIVDSVNAFYLVNLGKMSLWVALGIYLLPTLIGNVIGGVSLVAVLNYGQVIGEPKEKQSQGRNDGH